MAEQPRHPALPAKEQPPRGRKAPAQQTLLERAANDWELADASAIKALQAGTADAAQQRRALDWILKKACALPEWAYVPGDEHGTHVHLGRQFAGHMIMKLLQMNMATAQRREPNADAHEPKPD